MVCWGSSPRDGRLPIVAQIGLGFITQRWGTRVGALAVDPYHLSDFCEGIAVPESGVRPAFQITAARNGVAKDPSPDRSAWLLIPARARGARPYIPTAGPRRTYTTVEYQT
eukprot:4586809-Prymnesium_polylepis.1